ncbi:unnamed protein product, partial [Polarella glacialis]
VGTALRRGVEALAMEQGRLGSTESRLLRGDRVAWPDLDDALLGPALKSWLGELDALVWALKPMMPAPREMGGVAAREPPMATCYPKGARYIRHYDNNCEDGEGKDCNGRRLTAIYYLNEGACDEDGGHLRILTQRGGVHDVLPEFDVLVLFWADRRTPHEVLPNCGRDRYALSCWYVDKTEAPEAPAEQLPPRPTAPLSQDDGRIGQLW